jgi:hypothetical protein
VSRLSTSITRRIAAGLVALVAVVGLSTVSAQPASAAVTRQLTTASCTIDNLWPAADETKIYKLEYERISGNGQVRLVSVGASGGKNQGPKIYTSNQGSYSFTNMGSMHEVSGNTFANSFTWYGTGGGCTTTTRTVT